GYIDTYGLTRRNSVMSSYPPSEWEDTTTISDFKPITALNLSNADVHVAFLSNFAHYTSPSSDLWFRTQQKPDINGNGATGYFYSPLNTVSALACGEQHSFCTPDQYDTNECPPPSSVWNAGQYPINYR